MSDRYWHGGMPPADDITCHPRRPRERESKRHARAHRAFVKGLERYARRETRRLRRTMRGAAVETVIWGRDMQDAWLQQGWVPVKEEVMIEGYTKMTMRLDP